MGGCKVTFEKLKSHFTSPHTFWRTLQNQSWCSWSVFGILPLLLLLPLLPLKVYVCSPNGSGLYWEIGIFNPVSCGGIPWALGSTPLFNSYKALLSLTPDTGLDSRPFRCNLHQRFYFSCNHSTLYTSTKSIKELKNTLWGWILQKAYQQKPLPSESWWNILS